MVAELTPRELRLVEIMRARNPAEKIPRHDTKDMGQKAADRITKIVGSWHFIIIQSFLLAAWIVVNVVGYVYQWDPYPFILLNLCLSFQAAYTAPVILMSQNREAELDRQTLQYYYEVNLKEELEIELLHQKIDEIAQMLTIPIAEREISEIMQHEEGENID
jgi:uncharacterized membrane protein